MTLVTVGAGDVGQLAAGAAVSSRCRSAVVAVTSTVPVPDGALTVRVVELVTLTEVPALEPKSTVGVAPPRPRRSPVP